MTSDSNVSPPTADNTRSVIQASPSTSRVVNTPVPAEIIAPENENPNTVPVPPKDTENPASSAAPPETEVAPETLNWKPAIS